MVGEAARFQTVRFRATRVIAAATGVAPLAAVIAATGANLLALSGHLATGLHSHQMGDSYTWRETRVSRTASGYDSQVVVMDGFVRI